MASNHRSVTWNSFGTAFAGNHPLEALIEGGASIPDASAFAWPSMGSAASASSTTSASSATGRSGSTEAVAQDLLAGHRSSESQPATTSESGSDSADLLSAPALAEASAPAPVDADAAPRLEAIELDLSAPAVQWHDFGTAHSVLRAEVARDVAPASSAGDAGPSAMPDDSLLIEPQLESAPGRPARCRPWPTTSGSASGTTSSAAPRRYYNIDDNGTGANAGVLHYNLGWSPDDGNGITAARQTIAREAFKVFEQVLGIDFVETTATDTSVDFFFGDNVSRPGLCLFGPVQRQQRADRLDHHQRRRPTGRRLRRTSAAPTATPSRPSCTRSAMRWASGTRATTTPAPAPRPTRTRRSGKTTAGSRP